MINRPTAAIDLFERRQKHGLTIEKVSEKTGVSKSTIIDIEKDRRLPGAITLYKLNQYFESLGNEK